MTDNLPKIKVPCTCCLGSGKIALTGRYLETYRLLSHNPGAIGADLARIAGVNPTAMNNRLSWLADKGLATFTQFGKKKMYTVVLINENHEYWDTLDQAIFSQ